VGESPPAPGGVATPERAVLLRAIAAILAISAVSLLFIASYAGALHEPRAHEVPLAVTAQVPAQIAQQLASSQATRVRTVADRAAALREIDERKVYGAVVATSRGVDLVVAPAAGPAVASALEQSLVPQLERAGAKVRTVEVHTLPAGDARGLVGFYTAVGWVVAGYLGAAFLGIIFGTRPGRLHTVWRLGGIAVLGLIAGFGGAVLAAAIGDFEAAFSIGLIGALTIVSVGAVTVALQSAFGIVGTGVAILIFVVLGNPASGGPFPGVLLPGLWRVVGELIPTGAATTAIRNLAYFPDASIAGPLIVLLAWLAAGAGVALGLGQRRGPLTTEEAQGTAAGVVPP
jgi:hypothetical protein